MNMRVPAQLRSTTPGLVSYSTSPAKGEGKIELSHNVLDVHEASIPKSKLEQAHAAGGGLTCELVGSLHSHDVTLTAMQVGTLVATGHLTVESHRALLHSHTVTLSVDANS